MYYSEILKEENKKMKKNIFLQIGLIGILLLSVGYVDAQRYVDANNVYVSTASNYGEIHAVNLDYTNNTISDYDRILYLASTGYRMRGSIIPTLTYIYLDSGSQSFNNIVKYNKTNTQYEVLAGGNRTFGGMAVYGSDLYYHGIGDNIFKFSYENMSLIANQSSNLANCLYYDADEWSFSSTKLYIPCQETLLGYVSMNHSLDDLQFFNISYTMFGDSTDYVDSVSSLDIDFNYEYVLFTQGDHKYTGIFSDGGESIDTFNLSEIGWSNTAILYESLRVIGNYIYAVGEHDLNKIYVVKFNKNLDLVSNKTYGVDIGIIQDTDTDYDNTLYIGVENAGGNASTEGLYVIQLSDLSLTKFIQDDDGVRGLGISSYKGGVSVGQRVGNIKTVNYLDDERVGEADVLCYLSKDDVNLDILPSNSSGQIDFIAKLYDDYILDCEIGTENVYPTQVLQTSVSLSIPDYIIENRWYRDASLQAPESISILAYDTANDTYIEKVLVHAYNPDGALLASNYTDTNGKVSMKLPLFTTILFKARKDDYNYTEQSFIFSPTNVFATIEMEFVGSDGFDCYADGYITDEDGLIRSKILVLERLYLNNWLAPREVSLVNGFYNFTELVPNSQNTMSYKSTGQILNSWFTDSTYCTLSQNFTMDDLSSYRIFPTKRIGSTVEPAHNAYIHISNNTHNLTILGPLDLVDTSLVSSIGPTVKNWDYGFVDGVEYTILGVLNGYNNVSYTFTALDSTVIRDINLIFIPLTSFCLLDVSYRTDRLYDPDNPFNVLELSWRLIDRLGQNADRSGTFSATDTAFSRTVPHRGISVPCNSKFDYTINSRFFSSPSIPVSTDGTSYTRISMDLVVKAPPSLSGNIRDFNRWFGEGSRYLFWLAMIVIGLFFVANGVMMLRQIGF